MGDLPRIRFLSLRRNGLTGNIPPALGNLGSLSYLELDGNMLSGSSAEDSTCVAGLPTGTRATLSATPADQFGAWGGHCVGSDPTTTVLLDRDRSCTARFGAVRLTQRTMTASNGPVRPGSAVRYSVTLGNTGTGDQRDNVGPELTDVLPAQLEAVSATATSGTVQVSGNAVYWNGAVPAGATVDLLIDARVRVDVPTGTTISNQATIAWDVDGDGANETTAPTDDPRSPGALDPTLIAVSPSLAFHTLEPCRAVDTRQEGPALAPGPERVFAMAGRCGVPTGAAAVAANLTVVGPTAGGHLRLHPAGTPSPDASSINYVAGATRANNAVLTLSPNGELAVDCRQPSGTVHLVIDIVGYFE